MKIYTKTGDDGSTGLIGGSRALKHDPAIEAYGTVDELNASIGWVAAAAADEATHAMLHGVQGELFAIGSHLATPADETTLASSLPPLSDSWTARLESQIDAAESSLPPLRNFILPGGSELAARLHVARTVCRRAERSITLLGVTRPLDAVILRYINRLSDWLFVQARRANQVADVADVAWVSR